MEAYTGAIGKPESHSWEELVGKDPIDLHDVHKPCLRHLGTCHKTDEPLNPDEFTAAISGLRGVLSEKMSI